MSEAALDVERLTAGFDVGSRFIAAVRDVSLRIERGETLCLVGESGSGKTLTALSIIRLLPPHGRIAAGRVRIAGQDLSGLSEAAMNGVRGARVGFVFQEPAAALSPVFTIGRQIEETLLVHKLADRRSARRQAIDLLEAVHVPDAARRAQQYPHELSGGLQQRAMIAIAIACRPALLIADEPTTALDVTIQAQILELLRALQQRLGLALLLITHDLGIVASVAHRVAVMYAGRIVETGSAAEVVGRPLHPYTRGLLGSLPSGAPRTRLRGIEGTVPAPGDLPRGCAFAPRCPERFAPCPEAHPGDTLLDGRSVKCYLHGGAAEAPGELA